MDNEFEEKNLVKALGIQAVFFWQGLDMSQPLLLAQRVNESLGPVFDGEPAVLPPPKNVPRTDKVPRIILSTGDGRYKCNISAVRADVIFAESSPDPPELASEWERYGRVLEGFTGYMKEESPAIVIRLGIVFRLFRQLDFSGNNYIQDNLLQKTVSGFPFEAHVNLLHKLRMDRFAVNRWMRLRSLRKKQDADDDRALMMEVDINTIDEEKRPLGVYEILRFFETAYQHLAEEDIKFLLMN